MSYFPSALPKLRSGRRVVISPSQLLRTRASCTPSVVPRALVYLRKRRGLVHLGWLFDWPAVARAAAAGKKPLPYRLVLVGSDEVFVKAE